MAFRDLFRPRLTPGSPPVHVGGLPRLRSPYAEITPTALVYRDIFDGVERPETGYHYTRAEAMKVPSIAAGRNRVIEHLAGRPLVDYTADGGRLTRTEAQPAWLTRTDSVLAISPYARMVATLDDHIFDGVSLWAVKRSGDSLDEALHVPFERWSMDDYGIITIDGEEVRADQVLLIPGAQPGLLHVGQHTIEGGLALEQAWRSRVRNPVPSIILSEREDNGMTLDEAQEYVDAVAAARRNPNGAVMFIPYRLQATFEEHEGESFLESARNAIRLDVAAYFNLTAQAIEASKTQSTLTYETAETADQQTADRMAFWSEPIEQRLSLDDVVPSGHLVRFNFHNEHHPATGTPTED